MGQVSASSSIAVAADPQRVLDAIADYQTVRPRILTSKYTDYKVVEGGTGTGTVAEWKFQARESKPPRAVRAAVTVSDSMVTERDANSSMVNTWTVTPDGTGSQVTLRTTWNGAGGVAGIFEGIFAPLGLKKVHAETLENLAREIG
ncbi:SRPBCC family protein [Nocardia sp. NPDC051832]|uniref:SRPBCC family protein n=1 Tax=Nocardia sp. NPDC051832 TaxID=3155673 RepID=UPI0034321431